MGPARCGTDPRRLRTRRVRSWAGSDAQQPRLDIRAQSPYSHGAGRYGAMPTGPATLSSGMRSPRLREASVDEPIHAVSHTLPLCARGCSGRMEIGTGRGSGDRR
jgi:hypothetical protein